MEDIDFINWDDWWETSNNWKHKASFIFKVKNHVHHWTGEDFYATNVRKLGNISKKYYKRWM